ncbi:MAG: cytochrome c biogenesis protein [Nitrospirota bacterium]|nr:cytochrome c biogenesis protein [Nitrospirota bacterium]
MNVLYFELAMTAYLIAAVLFLVYLPGSGRRETLLAAALGGTLAGFVFHTAALTVRWRELGGFPVTTAYEAASFFSWTLILVFLLFDFRLRIHVLGAFAVPLAFLSVFAAALLRTSAAPLDPRLQGLGLTLHTSLMVLGAVAFCISFLAGIMYVIQMRLLKSKHFGNLYAQLPPLEVCDAMIARGVLGGFPLTTLGLLSGAIGARYVWGHYWEWTPKETVSLLVWGFYLLMLLGRYWLGMRAQRGAYLAIAGFLAVMLSFMGIDVVLGEHRHF